MNINIVCHLDIGKTEDNGFKRQKVNSTVLGGVYVLVVPLKKPKKMFKYQREHNYTHKYKN